jgi:glycosyltransferase involved in cell wall biosynthesis
MRVLYFGTFDSQYGRNWVLINGLKKNGVEVIELSRPPGRLNLVKLFFDYIKARIEYDAMIVGFSGQEAMFIARLLTRKPIIFDAFTSHYGGYILNRKRFSEHSFHATYYRFLDTWSCKLADIILLESQAYIDFFVREYRLSPEKFRRIWIGANDKLFQPAVSKIHGPDDVFQVIFFGTYVPVQGAEYIVKAAKILEQERIIFTFCGKGQDGPKAYGLAKQLGLKNIIFKGMLDGEHLVRELANADVSLGNFGDTPLAPLIISNKVYEALASRKPVITSDMPANREFFSEGEVVFVPLANAEALAQEILTLKNNPSLRERVARRGYEKFVMSASPQVLGGELKAIIQELI